MEDNKEFSVQDVEVDYHSGLPDSKKGTTDDARDMYRMGKSQEMRVSTPQMSTKTIILTNFAEKFQICHYLWFLYDSDGIMGGSIRVRRAICRGKFEC